MGPPFPPPGSAPDPFTAKNLRHRILSVQNLLLLNYIYTMYINYHPQPIDQPSRKLPCNTFTTTLQPQKPPKTSKISTTSKTSATHLQPLYITSLQPPKPPKTSKTSTTSKTSATHSSTTSLQLQKPLKHLKPLQPIHNPSTTSET